VVRIHAVDGTEALRHTLPLGLSPAAEEARWRHAADELELPTIFEDGASVWSRRASVVPCPFFSFERVYYTRPLFCGPLR